MIYKITKTVEADSVIDAVLCPKNEQITEIELVDNNNRQRPIGYQGEDAGSLRKN